MAGITKENILEQLEKNAQDMAMLERQMKELAGLIQQTQANIHAVNGSTQMCNQWLDQIKKEEEESGETSEEA